MGQLKRLYPYLKPHYSAIALALVCLALSGITGGAFLLLMERVLTPMFESKAPEAQRLRELHLFTLLVLGVALLRAFVDFGQVYLTQRVGQSVLAGLRANLFGHFQALSVGFFEKQRTGDLLSRMTNDLTALQTAMTLAVRTAIAAPIEVVVALGIMFHFNWRLSLFVFLILPPVAFLVNRAGTRVKRAVTLQQEQLGALVNYLQEKIAAMRLIQTFGTKAHEIALFEEVNDETYRRTMKPIRIQATFAPLIEFVGMLGVVGSLWFGARDVIGGRMEAAALLPFLFAVHRVAMQGKALANLNLIIKTADAAASRLFEMIDTQPDIRDAPDAMDLNEKEVHGHLVFDNVRFSYDGNDEVLNGISFEIKPGEVVALAGLSGSGKTTISNLVPRLYDPTGGRVMLDGHDLRDVSQQSLRDHIGAVPQHTTLFDGNIRDNIAYGRPNASREEIVEAARRANADGFIRDSLPEGYDTPVGERGGRLSGGQQQRIAIARALLRDPRLLILDEATSSLDAQSEGLIQEAFATLMKGRTTLIIAHRFSTIQNANRILVLDKGRIAESGTHTELLAEKGLYYRLYQMQAFASRQHESEGESESDQNDEQQDFHDASQPALLPALQ